MSPEQGVKRQSLVSVVICSIEAGKFARVTENYSRLLAQQPFEITSRQAVTTESGIATCAGFKEKFQDRLPATWSAQDGAAGSFFAANLEEVLARCQPDKLSPILRQIAQANASLR